MELKRDIIKPFELLGAATATAFFIVITVFIIAPVMEHFGVI